MANLPQYWQVEQGLRIPSKLNPAREAWDKAYHERVKDYFLNRDEEFVEHVVPIEDIEGSHNVIPGHPRTAGYTRMYAAGDHPPPMVGYKKGHRFHLLDGNRRLSAASDAGVTHVKVLVATKKASQTKPRARTATPHAYTVSAPGKLRAKPLKRSQEVEGYGVDPLLKKESEAKDAPELPEHIERAMAAITAPGVLIDSQRRPKYRGHPNPLAGHCFVATETLFHLINGRNTGWQMCVIPKAHLGGDDTHWFLRHKKTGTILDPTASQFEGEDIPYEHGNPCGTSKTGPDPFAPTKRADETLTRARAWLNKSKKFKKAEYELAPLTKMGAMQRLAPMKHRYLDNPAYPNDKPLEYWQSGDWNVGPEHREAVAPMEGPILARGLHRLHAHPETQTRRNPKTGQREFLLHRGMSGEEHDAGDMGTGHFATNTLTSWSPVARVAEGFGVQRDEGRHVSAWVPDNAVHAFGNMNPRTAGGELSSEFEVIVKPGEYERGQDPRPLGKASKFPQPKPQEGEYGAVKPKPIPRLPSLAVEKRPEFQAWHGEEGLKHPKTGRPLRVFHGTHSAIEGENFSPDDFGGPLAWFSAHPKFAESYAGVDVNTGARGNITPAYLRGKFFDYREHGEREAINYMQRGGYAEIQDDERLAADYYGKLPEEFNPYEGKVLDTDRYPYGGDEFVSHVASGSWPALEHLGFLDHLKRKGYAGILHHEGGYTNYGVFRPEHSVKSPFSRAFDPEHPDMNKEEVDAELSKMARFTEPRPVYRVENDAGEGPYEGGAITGTDWRNWSSRLFPAGHALADVPAVKKRPASDLREDVLQPPPHMDTGLNLKDQQWWDSRLDDPKKKANTVFGFDTPEHALRWFGDLGLRDMHRSGFKLRQVMANQGAVSRYSGQVIFEPHETYQPGKAPSYNWLPHAQGLFEKKPHKAFAAPLKATTTRPHPEPPQGMYEGFGSPAKKSEHWLYKSMEPMAKMALVHDDPKNPKEVYRVQDQQGGGPYGWGSHQTGSAVSRLIPRGKPELRYTDEREESPNPPPYGDLPQVEVDEAQTGDELYGFASPEHALKWFGDKGLHTLAQHGYHLVKVPAAKVWEGKHQAVFHPNTAYQAEKFDWREYLNGLGEGKGTEIINRFPRVQELSGLKLPGLTKAAPAGLTPPTTGPSLIRRNEQNGAEGWDYSHLLPIPARAMGYGLVVQHHPATKNVTAHVTHDWSPVGQVAAYLRGPEVTVAHAYVKGIDPEVGRHVSHQGKGLATSMMTAVKEHAAMLGAQRMSGGAHSTIMSRIHRKISGGNYVAERNVGKGTQYPTEKVWQDTEPHEMDSKYAPYSYPIEKAERWKPPFAEAGFRHRATGKIEKPFMKGPAFRHITSGKVVATPVFHDTMHLGRVAKLKFDKENDEYPEAYTDWEAGFIDHAGNFFNRENALSAVTTPKTPSSAISTAMKVDGGLESTQYAASSKTGIFKAEGFNPGDHPRDPETGEFVAVDQDTGHYEADDEGNPTIWVPHDEKWADEIYSDPLLRSLFEAEEKAEKRKHLKVVKHEFGDDIGKRISGQVESQGQATKTPPVPAKDLYRGYKQSSHHALAHAMRYVIHRIEHVNDYDDPTKAQALDQKFLADRDQYVAHSGTPLSKQLGLGTLHALAAQPDLVHDLLNNRDRLHNRLKGRTHVENVGGEPSIALSRGLPVGKRPAEEMTTSYTDDTDEVKVPWAEHFHNHWVPLKNLWGAYDMMDDEVFPPRRTSEAEYIVSPHAHQVASVTLRNGGLVDQPTKGLPAFLPKKHLPLKKPSMARFGSRLAASELDPYEPAAAAIMVQNAAGHVLWGRRRKDGKWCMPGGHIEAGEQPTDAAIRELHEETGITVPVMFNLGAANTKNIPVHRFMAVEPMGTPTNTNDPDREFDSFAWVDCFHGLPTEMYGSLAHGQDDVFVNMMGWQQPAGELGKNEHLDALYARSVSRRKQYGAKSSAWIHPVSGKVVPGKGFIHDPADLDGHEDGDWQRGYILKDGSFLDAKTFDELGTWRDQHGDDLGKAESPFREAGYRHQDGRIFGTGAVHEPSLLPSDARADVLNLTNKMTAGFIGHDGRFYTRDEATDLVKPIGEGEESHLLHSTDMDLGKAENQVVYHGTNHEGPIKQFRTPAYFTDKKGWATAFGAKQVIAAKLKLKNPYVIDGVKEGRHFDWDAEDVERMRGEGHDGVQINHPDGNVYTVFDPEQVDIQKAAPTGMKKPRQVEESPAFQRFFEGSKVVDPKGKPQKVFHGTIHDIKEFATSRGNPENYHGRQHYFTSNPKDAASNYSSLAGPDRRSRIENLNELRDSNVDDSVIEAEAKKLRPTAGPNVMPVYLAMKNPVHLTPEGGTRFHIEQEYNPETDEYGAESGNGVDLMHAIRSVSHQYGADGDQVWEDLTRNHTEDLLGGSGLTAHALEEALRNNEELGDVLQDADTGASLRGDFIANVYKQLGHDGIVVDAHKYFTNMPHMVPGTNHYVVFNPRHIKSAIGNKGTFSPRSPNITKGEVQHGPAVVRKELRAAGGAPGLWDTVKQYPKWVRRQVPLSDMRIYDDALDQDKVSEYSQGVEYAPSVVLHPGDPSVPGEKYDILDGSHRAAAARMAGVTSLDAWVPEDAPVTKVELGSAKQVGEQMGSNPGGVFNIKGKDHYVKFAHSPDHARNEHLAAKLYEATGHQAVPIEHLDDQVGTASPMIPIRPLDFNNPKHRKMAHEGFATHAWLANWDAVVNDNTAIHENKPIVMDTGGALLFRAQGAPKGKHFGDKVTEFDTLRDPDMNWASHKVFGDMTPKDLQGSVAKVAAVPDETITRLCLEHGPGDLKARKALAEKLIARKNHLASLVGAGEMAKSEEDWEEIGTLEKTEEGWVLEKAGKRISIDAANAQYRLFRIIHDAHIPGLRGDKYRATPSLPRVSTLEGEDTHTPRVSVAPTIDQAVAGIHGDRSPDTLDEQEWNYVHGRRVYGLKTVPKKGHVPNQQVMDRVPDANITGEEWLTSPATFEYVGHIRAPDETTDFVPTLERRDPKKFNPPAKWQSVYGTTGHPPKPRKPRKP